MKAELINYMGDDLTVVNAAKVSFDKESEYVWSGSGAEEAFDLNNKDQKLIKYLTSHNHFTPFTHCMVTLRETVPIFVARQRFKHTVGFSYNEVSRRYVDGAPEFFTPVSWRGKASNKKQGSSDEEVQDYTSIWGFDSILEDVNSLNEDALNLYTHMVKSGVAPEQARMVLPQSMYTSYYVTGSLAAFARAYKLRNSPDAQYEIRELADQWNTIIRPLFPHSWKALTNDGA